jgi:S1-C subfamily serine protease
MAEKTKKTVKSNSKKDKKPTKKKIKIFNIQNPEKAGIMAFVIMLVVSALILGSIITFVIINFLLPQKAQQVETTNNRGLNVVVTQDENAVINVVENARDAVVSIAVTQLSFSTEEGIVDQNSNIGTGFIVDSNGIIVTNQHVVSDLESDYVVITSAGDQYNVVDIERDNTNDIAVLKIDATELPTLTLGDSNAIIVGQTVIAIGTPLGEYVGSVTTGIVSGLDRDVVASTGWFGSTAKTYENVIQTDAAVNPGNSGGPLLNTSGKVIGVNFATTSGADNIAFALPINVVKDRVEEYRTYGKFIKPYLGVSYQMISDRQALYYENVVAGALIVRVDPYGPAQKAGIERGDIIIEFAGEAVDQSLANLISKKEVGQDVELKVWNNGKERTVTVTLQEQE